MKTRINRISQFSQLATLLVINGIFTTTNTRVIAQITPDNTLGTEKSVVNQVNNLKDLINGGATRGTNLFHSFENFNVGENRSVYFANPVGIENILTRVTGSNVSNILGTLGVEGTANLFLLNPNGIIFGENASLDIRGSFTATTADEIKLGENGLFSATHPQSSNLLSVQPGALFRNAIKNQKSTINNQANLTVDNTNNLTLFSANLTSTGTLIAPGGKIELTGTENLQVRGNIETGTLLLDTKNLTIGENDNVTIQKATLEGFSGNTNLIFQATNDITIHAVNNNNLIFTNGSGEITFTADNDDNGIGNLQMDNADTIITNGRNISISGVNLNIGNINTSSELGGGNITLTATQGNITTKILNSSSSFIENSGNGGNITLNAQGNITTESLNSSSFTNFETAGNGGDITLNAQGNIHTQSLDSSSRSNNGTAGNSGNILFTSEGNIYTQSLNSSSFSFIGSGGNNGGISLNAKGNISTQAVNSSSESLSGTGINGGDIFISAGGNISTLNLLSNSFLLQGIGGNGGKISLHAGGNISTSNLFSNSFSLGETAGTGTAGNGGDISLIAGSNIDAQNLSSYSFIEAGTAGNGGNIFLLADGIISSNNLYSYSFVLNGNGRNGGNISLFAGDYIQGINNNSRTEIPAFYSFAISQIGDSGQGGNVNLTARNNITDIEVLTLSSDSQSGSVKIQGLADLSLINTNIITANQVTIPNPFTGIEIIIDVGGVGESGSVDVNSDGNLTFNNSRIISDTRGSNPAGNININSFGTITFNNNSQITSNSSSTGEAGNIQITTQNLNITDGVQISASTSNLGKGGNIKVIANNVTATNGGQILTTTSGDATAGNIIFEVQDNINLDGTNTGLFANTEKGSKGDSGIINIDPKTVIIKNGAGIGVNSQGIGKGGDIYLQAGTLNLESQGFITAATASNQGGEINLNMQELLLLRNNSQITATAGTDGAGGDGGNININAPLIVAFPQENSDITANAFQGNGGQINITTNAIFGLELRPQLTPRSDITASSQFGLAGEVQINTPEVDPTSGLIELPGSLVDATNQLYQGCKRRGTDNRFTIVGRGGIPSHPSDLFTGTTPLVDLLDVVNSQEKIKQKLKSVSVNHQAIVFKNPVIAEAQGWIITADGRVILTAKVPNVNSQISGLYHPGCHVSTDK